jgi:hypothetical protein
MAECELVEACPFFNDKMPIDKGMGAVYKDTYCRAERDSCARYIVRKALGKEKVPADLYPHMMLKAREILKKG